jgi:NAD(P)-dependent dehydrogenase (short-subunit alcohol dehydrogenase family)
MDLGLAGKVVLVTGGSRGIGKATAEAFRSEGATVVITYREDAAAAKAVAERLGTCPLRYALEEPDSAEQLMAAVIREWGATDVLVANALARAARRPQGTRFEDIHPAQWERSVSANLHGTLRLAQLAVAGMRPRGWGRLAFISSHVVQDGQPGQEFYAAGKAGLHGLIPSLAWDAGPDGILANVICPGLTTTKGVLTDLPATIRDRERGRTPTGRLSTPADIAQAVVFLCSQANGNITGQRLTVAGGRLPAAGGSIVPGRGLAAGGRRGRAAVRDRVAAAAVHRRRRGDIGLLGILTRLRQQCQMFVDPWPLKYCFHALPWCRVRDSAVGGHIGGNISY